jgi:hypothetical protein
MEHTNPQARKKDNFKKEMQKKVVSVLGISEGRQKGQSEIRSGDYAVNYPEVKGLKRA